MAFPSAAGNQIFPVGAGEVFGQIGVISSYIVFEENIEAGKFVKYNKTVDGIEKINGSANPTIAGVVKRNVTDAVESYGVCIQELTNKIDVVESGIVTVEVVEGLTINKFDKVYVCNDGNNSGELGKATNQDTGVGIDGYFYKKISDNVWAIRIK